MAHSEAVLFLLLALTVPTTMELDPNYEKLFSAMAARHKSTQPACVLRGTAADRPPTICHEARFSCVIYDSDEEVELALRKLAHLDSGGHLDMVVFDAGDHSKLLRRFHSETDLVDPRRLVILWRGILAELPPVRLDSNVVFYEEVASGFFKLYDEYTIKDGRVNVSAQVGSFNAATGEVNAGYDDNLFERRRNLRGIELHNSFLAYRLN